MSQFVYCIGAKSNNIKVAIRKCLPVVSSLIISYNNYRSVRIAGFSSMKGAKNNLWKFFCPFVELQVLQEIYK